MSTIKNFAKGILCLSTLLLSFPSFGQTAWDGTSKQFDNGDGTEANPFLIECPAHLAYFGEQVRAGVTYEGQFIKQTVDLDMGGIEMLPIGLYDEYDYVDEGSNETLHVDQSKYFLGTFDGSNKTIDNLFVYYISDSEGVHGEPNVGGTALFACIAKNAVVKRVVIGKNSIIQGGDLVASVVSVINNGLVTDCVFEGEIKSGDPNPTFMGGDPGNFVGGIVTVCNKGTVQRCTNRGVVNGNMGVAGVVETVDFNGTVTDCLNEGRVEASYVWNGGIMGLGFNGSISNCLNVGVINGYENFLASPQAIAGEVEKEVTISNCYYLIGDGLVEDENDGVEGVTADDIKTDAFLELLDKGNGNWVMGETHPVIKVIEDVNTGINSAFDNDTEVDVKVAANNIMVITNKECQVTVISIDGKVCDNFVVNGYGSMTVENNGMYIVNIKSDNTSKAIKVLVK